jgi:Tfp pilus assembly protein PilE
LVVVAVIGILTAIMLGASVMVRNSARAAKTQATIVKLNNIIMERYESYLTRRVPINTSGMSPHDAAQARLAAIRQLMRLEMPDNITDTFTAAAKDVTQLSVLPVNIQNLLKVFKDNPPVLWSAYNQRIPASVATIDAPVAVCLYMVVSMGSPEAMEQFSQDEIGTVAGRDTTGAVVSQFPVFVDGWGTPILWQRWAPGCSQYSDIQAIGLIGSATPTGTPAPGDTAISIASSTVVTIPIAARFTIAGETVNAIHTVTARTPTGANTTTASITFTPPLGPGTYVSGASLTYVPDPHDPFDSRAIEPAAYSLQPLIYSCGVDRNPGVFTGGYADTAGSTAYAYNGDPYAYWYDTVSAQWLQHGAALPGDSSFYDNITNHHIETR